MPLVQTVKIFAAIGFIMILFCACRNDPRAAIPQTGSFGKALNGAKVFTLDEVIPDQQTMAAAGEIKVAGLIGKYCKGEGCWLVLVNAAGTSLRCEIENKAFALPRKITGKSATVQGHLFIDTVKETREPVMLVNGMYIQ